MGNSHLRISDAGFVSARVTSEYYQGDDEGIATTITCGDVSVSVVGQAKAVLAQLLEFARKADPEPDRTGLARGGSQKPTAPNGVTLQSRARACALLL